MQTPKMQRIQKVWNTSRFHGHRYYLWKFSQHASADNPTQRCQIDVCCVYVGTKSERFHEQPRRFSARAAI